MRVLAIAGQDGDVKDGDVNVGLDSPLSDGYSSPDAPEAGQDWVFPGPQRQNKVSR